MHHHLLQTNPVPGLTRDLPVHRHRPQDHEAPDQVRGGVAVEKAPTP
jgi:hypothetical protein